MNILKRFKLLACGSFFTLKLVFLLPQTFYEVIHRLVLQSKIMNVEIRLKKRVVNSWY